MRLGFGLGVMVTLASATFVASTIFVTPRGASRKTRALVRVRVTSVEEDTRLLGRRGGAEG